jgi:hypothetical protein
MCLVEGHQCIGAATDRRLKDHLIVRIVQLGTPTQIRFDWFDQGRQGVQGRIHVCRRQA